MPKLLLVMKFITSGHFGSGGERDKIAGEEGEIVINRFGVVSIG